MKKFDQFIKENKNDSVKEELKSIYRKVFKKISESISQEDFFRSSKVEDISVMLRHISDLESNEYYDVYIELNIIEYKLENDVIYSDEKLKLLNEKTNTILKLQDFNNKLGFDKLRLVPHKLENDKVRMTYNFTGNQKSSKIFNTSAIKEIESIIGEKSNIIRSLSTINKYKL